MAIEPPDPNRPIGPPQPSRRRFAPVSQQTFWVALIATAILAAGAGLGLSALVLGGSNRHAGPPGPRGQRGLAGAAGAPGPPGRTGPRGPAGTVDNAAVLRAISANPGGAATAIQPQLKPDPATLCRDLKRDPSLSHTALPC